MPLDLDHFRAKLASAREALIEQDRRTEADRAPVTLEQDSVGRLSRIDAMQMQAMALAESRRRQIDLAGIAATFRRIEDGEFGFCISCGEDIAPARLEHNPGIATCINCARKG
ncbi:TraR/DksA family transcriptional regulator [Sphingobium scionense]|jgi:DnaK suppressor protein|uniref:DnaK suppressor protein n=1 Tax=Sphingobium scionense TaxID=1404341 RepID=A0A7W6LXK6_9SPHN|nr:DnaK suppressor protein [Sphingobium scionense]MDE0945364.1 TraR/DksA C4-type zinc finger protein [Sphingobium sp.]|tara:strand:+ start:2503 stop:2841 length:339 start_codon:yes stop_codon:yes gene_type:complete